MKPEELTEKIIEIVNFNKNYEDIDYDTLRKELIELLKSDNKQWNYVLVVAYYMHKIIQGDIVSCVRRFW